MLCLNAQGLVNENTRWKIDALKEYVNTNNIILMNFTETWLKKKMQDEKIPNFTTFRCDRKSKKSKGGGTAIYLKNGFEARLLLEDRVESCEIVAIHIERINVVNIVVYRPPDTHSTEFTNVMDKIKKLLKELTTPEPSVIITGDFNFPFIEWKRGELNACKWKLKTYSNAKEDEKKQFYKLMDIMDSFHLVQMIQEPTRKENTLDLVFTNNTSLFSQVEVTGTCLSDHDIIEITTSIPYNNNNLIDNNKETLAKENDLRTLNFHHENVSWDRINEILEKMPWKKLFEGKNNKECTEIFIYCIRRICLMIIPKKLPKNKNKIPRIRKTMLNRIKMLKRKKNTTRDKTKLKSIENDIIETEKRLVEHRKQEKNTTEIRVIEKMKENPKVFYDHIKRQKDIDTKIGPFKINKEYIYDTEEICKLLIKQYNSQFSKGCQSSRINEDEIYDIKEGDLSDIVFNEEDIANAINKLKKNSAAGPDGIPAIFLLNTRDSIKLPLQIILRRSLDEGDIHDVFKLAYVTPIHKGGSKMNPANYRPVSLTSHVMKVFERVIKTPIIEHLEREELVKPNQHGFVSGRSTQSQLLQHYSDVYDALEEGVRIDTIYLDFAKAFDKVDHNILLKKVIDHKINGKVGIWIKNFLQGRKYRVVANGTISEEQEVISGVPQGTVLASILFIIMISDIDEELRNSISRLFADDTKISAKIRTYEDTKLLQKDLDKVYKWADDNLMEFNEKKFERMSHGHTEGVLDGAYNTKSGEEIHENRTVKDLGVLTSKNVSFAEHIDDIVLTSKIKAGILLRNFETREAGPMMQMFNSYIRSKLDYCSLVWNPHKREEIDKIEGVQRNFTSKIKGLEQLDYHGRLKKLGLYSLERRRERFLIINAWQQLEGEKENVLKLKTGKEGRRRCLRSATIPTTLDSRYRTIIQNSTSRTMERLYNSLPHKLQNIRNVRTDTFKTHLDRWLRSVPDTPRIGNYGASVSAETNSIKDQKNHKW